jgi:hypothetical protein
MKMRANNTVDSLRFFVPTRSHFYNQFFNHLFRRPKIKKGKNKKSVKVFGPNSHTVLERLASYASILHQWFML